MSEKKERFDRCIVVKFGGSSLADNSKIFRAAKAVAKEAAKGAKLIVVVSAMGKTTDLLMETAMQACGGSASDEELDDVLSMGERTSARMFSTALKANKVKCRYLDPTDPEWPIITDRTFTNAKPILPICEKLVRKYVSPLSEQKTVVIIPGFIGKTEDGKITTMGRGGSDTTALIMARALSADQVILVTDVDGIMTADPKLIKSPKMLKDIDVNTVIGLADSGAKFIHQKALKYKDPDIEIKVINHALGDLESEGTIIHGAILNDLIVETAYPSPAMSVTIVGNAISEAPEILQEVFQRIKEAEAPTLGVSINHNSLILYLPENGENSLLEALHSIVTSHGQTLALAVRKDLAFIRVKGTELEDTPGIINKIAEALFAGGINIFGIFTITSSVSVFVDLNDREKATKLIQKSIKGNRG
jgi:aspartate kinase